MSERLSIGNDRVFTVHVTVFAVLLLCATPSAAQQALTGGPPAQQAFEEITVTARKQEQRAFDVPLSLSVLRGEGLDRLRASGMDVRFLTNRAPSLQIESGFGRAAPRFYIRGLGNTDFDMNASQPVSVMLDGIPLENPFLKGIPIFRCRTGRGLARAPGHAVRTQHAGRRPEVRVGSPDLGS